MQQTIPQPYSKWETNVNWPELRKLALRFWSKIVGQEVECTLHDKRFDTISEPCWTCYYECVIEE